MGATGQKTRHRSTVTGALQPPKQSKVSDCRFEYGHWPAAGADPFDDRMNRRMGIVDEGRRCLGHEIGMHRLPPSTLRPPNITGTTITSAMSFLSPFSSLLSVGCLWNQVVSGSGCWCSATGWAVALGFALRGPQPAANLPGHRRLRPRPTGAGWV